MKANTQPCCELPMVPLHHPGRTCPGKLHIDLGRTLRIALLGERRLQQQEKRKKENQGCTMKANKTACAVTQVCTQTTNHKSFKSQNNQCSQHEGMHCRDDCWLLVWTCLIKEEICAHSQNRLRCLKGGSHFPCFVSGITNFSSR